MSDDARAWFQRTGHCHGCGQPGEWCLCAERVPCDCRDLHAMGSGIGRDPVDVFADVAPVVEQEEQLW